MADAVVDNTLTSRDDTFHAWLQVSVLINLGAVGSVQRLEPAEKLADYSARQTRDATPLRRRRAL